ncbi:hypothetical protein [Roseateles violae]|uniref:Uncharacterized protein n=1 Tax=Roseateles violae TaxID=3058042 RepID=A0ABT8DUP5_9BURK|nr:hypothetical protein [Pelomonas sp. PFR6]MDN3920629.1 hypothetical protein [Pelomonas sp. PFR6]
MLLASASASAGEGAVEGKAKDFCSRRGNPEVVLSDFRGQAEFLLVATVQDKRVQKVRMQLVHSSATMSAKAYAAYVAAYTEMAQAYGCERDGVFKQTIKLKVGPA